MSVKIFVGNFFAKKAVMHIELWHAFIRSDNREDVPRHAWDAAEAGFSKRRIGPFLTLRGSERHE
jgi:hypothetical protein